MEGRGRANREGKEAREERGRGGRQGRETGDGDRGGVYEAVTVGTVGPFIQPRNTTLLITLECLPHK